MMTDSGFSSKGEKPRTPLRVSLKRKLSGSLTLRIVFVDFFLLVIPLVVYSAFLMDRMYHLKTRDLLFTLSAFGEGEAQVLNRFIDLKIDFLKMIAVAGNPEAVMERIAIREEGSRMWYITEEKIEDWGALSQQVRCAFEKGSYVFMGKLPQTGEKMIFIAQALTKTSLALLGIPTDQLLDTLIHFEWTGYPFNLLILDEHGEYFTSHAPHPADLSLLCVFSKEEFSLTKDWMDTIEKKEELSFWHARGKDVHIGIIFPIRNAQFSLLVEIPKHVLISYIEDEVFFLLILSLGIIFILGTCGAVLLIRRFSRPLRNLSHVIEEVGKGELQSRYSRDILGFEFNLLGESFNRTVDSLIVHMKEAENQKLTKELFENELKIGYEIQKAILPRTMPSGVFESAIGFLPAKEVAGDFYDLFQKSDHEFIIAIADASGKGISACLYSLSCRSMLRTSSTIHKELSDILQATNRLFCLDSGDTGTFVTAWVGLYDTRTRRLQYSSCGHPPVLLKRKEGTIEKLATPGIALGVISPTEVSVSSTELQNGDLLFLYTDGVVEAHNEKHQGFGLQRLTETLRALEEKSSQEVIDTVTSQLRQFEKNTPQYDDQTLLAVRILSK